MISLYSPSEYSPPSVATTFAAFDDDDDDGAERGGRVVTGTNGGARAREPEISRGKSREENARPPSYVR